ncbi:MAG: hypothetical protein AAGE01_22510 [Pseudomonadota bacterium]
MKTFFRTTLLGLAWATAAPAQDLIVNSNDCRVALDTSQAVTFRVDGGIEVATAAALPVTCVSGVIGSGAPASVQAADPLSGALVSTADEDTEFVINYAVPDDFNCTLRKNGGVFLSNSNITRPSGTSPVETITADANYEMICNQTTEQGTAQSTANALVDYTGSGGGGGGGGITPGATCSTLPPGTLEDEITFDRNDETTFDASTVEDMFGAWPVQEDFVGRVYRLFLRRGAFYSFPFVIPPGTPDSEILNMIWQSDTGSSAGTTVSVSECVGGVLESQSVPQNSTSPLRFCHIIGDETGGAMRIGTSPNTANCVLERGRTYYLNFMDFDERDGPNGANTCSTSSCTFIMRPRDG